MFSDDKSPKGLDRLDADIKRDITGFKFSVVAKGVGGILAGVAAFFS